MIEIKKEDAKRNLVNLGYLDNEYLDKYLEIIYNNLETLKSVHTQKHHILPVKNYGEEALIYNRLTAVKKANEDKQNFLVNLLYKDHLTAHAYLTLCTNLDLAQAKYDRQAGIRKRNSQVGLKAVKLKYHKHKIATDKSSKNKQRWAKISATAGLIWKESKLNKLEKTWAQCIEEATNIIEAQT